MLMPESNISGTCGIGITPLSHVIHTNTHLNCVLTWFCCFQCYLCWAGKTRNVIQAGISIVFLWFIVHWHSDWEVPCSDMTVGGQHRHFCFIKYNTYLFIPLACAECDDSLPFSGASSIPLCYILFPSTLFHQLVFILPDFILPSISWSASQPCCFRINI
jgi:hypothetical protein